MINRFSRVPWFGGVTGVLFESLQQHRFAKKIDFVAEEMFRSSGARSRWHAKFGDFSANPVLRKAQESLNTGTPPPPVLISLNFSPWTLRVYYEHSKPLTINSKKERTGRRIR
jgi:hypothetical protein